MHALAAASSASPSGFFAYLVVFFLVGLGFAGVPGIASAVIGGAAVLASQGELYIAGVLAAAAIGAEAGGLLGYHIGDRWGRSIMAHPGRTLERRQRTVAKGDALFERWGRLAVFFTPSMISGIVRMEFSQFVVWNFLAGAAFVLSVGPAAYGAGKVSTGHTDPVSIGALAGGLAIAAGSFLLARWYLRRRKARRAPGGTAHARAEGVIRPAGCFRRGQG